MLNSNGAKNLPCGSPFFWLLHRLFLSFSCTKKRILLRRPRITWHISISPVMSISFLIISRSFLSLVGVEVCRMQLTSERSGLKPAWSLVNFSSTRGVCASVSVVRKAYMECTAARLDGSFLGRRGPSQALVWLSPLL